MRSITKAYGPVKANDDIDLTVAKGQVHGLLGENGAGKTTLMNILFGLVKPDSGSIEISGAEVDIASPRLAIELGVGMVHQHFQLVPTLTVAENIALGETGSLLELDLNRTSDRIALIADRYGLAVNPSSRVGDLAVGERQRVEILKLLFHDARILVLDEPTAVLTPPEWDQMSELIRRLAEDGRSIVFISHKLEEHFSVSDQCTVLRNGRNVGTVEMSTAREHDLVQMMVGRPVACTSELASVPVEPVVLLRAVDLRATVAGGNEVLGGISLEIRAGETLGVAGVDGNGQEHLVDALIGVLPLSSGSIELNGRNLGNMTPSAWRAWGGGLINADRHAKGVAQDLDLSDNLLITELGNADLVRTAFFRKQAVSVHLNRQLESFDIRSRGVHSLLRELSGGNQQKMVLAREFNREPAVLIAAQPSRGLDVGAARVVHDRITAHREAGGATLLISAELKEVLALSDRIVVMSRGRFLGPLENGPDLDFTLLASMIAGGSAQ